MEDLHARAMGKAVLANMTGAELSAFVTKLNSKSLHRTPL